MRWCLSNRGRRNARRVNCGMRLPKMDLRSRSKTESATAKRSFGTSDLIGFLRVSPPLARPCSDRGLVKMGGEGILSLEQNQALGPLEAALRESNFNLQVVEDAQSLIWGKLVINAAINPLTALLQDPEWRVVVASAGAQGDVCAGE
jgi:hypothetical protein